MYELIYFDVLVDVLAANQAIVKHVNEHGDNQPVAVHVASTFCNLFLNPRHHTAADNEHHEDTRSLLCVLAKSFYCHVEDATPHNAGAHTTEHEEQTAQGNLEHSETVGCAVAGHADSGCLWNRDGDENQDDCNTAHGNHLCTAADLA